VPCSGVFPAPPGLFFIAYILAESDPACRSFWLTYADFSVFDLRVYPCIAGNFAHTLGFSARAEFLSARRFSERRGPPPREPPPSPSLLHFVGRVTELRIRSEALYGPVTELAAPVKVRVGKARGDGLLTISKPLRSDIIDGKPCE
jgi:hypothetical protein